MNKSVPTLLGILIILVVVVIVVLVYNIQLTKQLGTGASPVGTIGGQMLTGEKAPTTEISPSEALARRSGKAEPIPQRVQQRAPVERMRMMREQKKRAESMTKKVEQKAGEE